MSWPPNISERPPIEVAEELGELIQTAAAKVKTGTNEFTFFRKANAFEQLAFTLDYRP